MSPAGHSVFKQRGRVQAAQTKTVLHCDFEVPSRARALTLRFDYSPRTCTDREVNRPLVERALMLHGNRRVAAGHTTSEELAAALNIDRRIEELHNLINVVLIDPEGAWRGRWDRNPSSDDGALTLCETWASKGFRIGPIAAGSWALAIEIHGIFGPAVDYEVEVCALEELPEAPAYQLSSTSVRAGKSGPNWYLGELHSHSTHSDGQHEVEELAEIVASHGADFLALTDHNTLSGHREDLDLPLTLLPGIELTTFHGHHPVYGLSEMVPWHLKGAVASLSAMAPKLRSQGALIGIAHPFVPGDPLCTGCRMVDGLDPASFDLLEVWYRRWNSPGADNAAARDLWDQLWRSGHRIIAVAARDWHRPDQAKPFPGEFPFTALWAEENSPEALLQALGQGRVVMTGGPLIDFSIQDPDGRVSARVGDSIAMAPDLRACVTLSECKEAGELRLYSSGSCVQTVPVDGDDLVHLDWRPGAGYHRVELWAANAPRAITNHIVVEP